MASPPSWAELSEQLEEVMRTEKTGRVEMMRHQRCSFFSLKLAVPLMQSSKAVDLQEAELDAMKARHTAFEACLEARQTADCRLQLHFGAAAAAIVESAITEALQAVWAEAVQRELWQLKEVEDQMRQALLDEEDAARKQNGLTAGQTIARRILQLTRTERSRTLAQQALAAEKKEHLSQAMATRFWDLNAEEAAARRQIVAEERLAMAKVRHLELRALKARTSSITAPAQSASKVDSIAFISDMVGAAELFIAQQQQQSRRLASQLQAGEAVKRQLLLQCFAAARSSLLKEMRIMEAKMWETWAAQQVAKAKYEEALECTTAQLVGAVLRQAVNEVAAELKSRAMSPRRGASLRLRPEEVREVAEQHAVTVSPVKAAAPPAPPPQAARPEEAKPEKTGRRIFIRRQGERLQKQQQEAAGSLWSAKDLSLVRKQQAVGRTMVNPKALTLPPIVSPFHVQATLLT